MPKTPPRRSGHLPFVGTALVAHGQTSVERQPSEGTLDHPAMLVESLATVYAAPSDARLDAPLDSGLFCGSLAVALAIAAAAALPVNYWLISRGKGHAAVHSHMGH